MPNDTDLAQALVLLRRLNEHDEATNTMPYLLKPQSPYIIDWINPIDKSKKRRQSPEVERRLLLEFLFGSPYSDEYV